MNKKIKLSLLGTLIAGSALAVTLPIVSCSASTAVVLTPTLSATADADATAAMTTYVAAAADFAAQQEILKKGNKITSTENTVFTALLSAVTFVQKDDTTVPVTAAEAIESFEVTTEVTLTTATEIAAGIILTVNLKGEYSTDAPITITLGALGDAK